MKKNNWLFNWLCYAGFAAIIIFMIVIINGCDSQIYEEKQDIIVPAHLGQGVYLFDCTCDQKWQKSLVKFMENNPDLKITAIYAASEGLHGITSKVIVVTEKRSDCSKNNCECDCHKNK